MQTALHPPQADPAAIDFTLLTEEDLATAYLQCRERKEKAEAAADRADAIMKTIKQAMLARMHSNGTSGFKIDGVATVTRTTRTNYQCADWAPFLGWVLDQANSARAAGRDPLDAFAFLHRRLGSRAVEEFMQANGGLPPPQIQVQSEYDVSVRKAG